MLPDIDSLALFVRAAELRSLTKAAEATHIGLAAASRRMALLEHRFKTKLLERSPRGVELTAAGLSLLVHVKEMLTHMNQIQAEMGDHAAGRKGVLRVLANTSALNDTLPEDLASFEQQNPDIRLLVEERPSQEIGDCVLAAQADLGVVFGGWSTHGLETWAYGSDRIAVVLRPQHPLVRSADLQFADVLDHDLVALDNRAAMMRLLTEHARQSSKPLRLRVQVRSFESVGRMVLAGFGVGLVSLRAALSAARVSGLIVRPLSEPWATRHMLLCARRGRPANPSLLKLVDHLRGLQACPNGQLHGRAIDPDQAIGSPPFMRSCCAKRS